VVGGRSRLDRDLAGKRFVITGLSRLTVRVATALHARGGGVTVIAPDGQDGSAARERSSLGTHLPDGVETIAGSDLEETLPRAALAGAECLLALDDDDLQNLAAAVTCHALEPTVPIVLRAYDISLADQLERGLNVRRAFSVSVLSAPAFLAAALGSDVLETLRLGDAPVPIWTLPIGDGSALAGASPLDAAAASGTQVLWRSGDARTQLHPGERVVVGGPLDRLVKLAMSGNALFAPPPGRSARGRHRREARRERRAARSSGWVAGGTLLPITAIVLAAFLIVAVLVFGIALHKNPIDAIYFSISTALGNSTLDDSVAWLKLFGVIAMIAGGALLGVLFSYLASVATTVRIEQRMGRHASRMSGHAVVAGLGSVGYRVGKLLGDSGIAWAGLDRAPDPRFAEAAGQSAPVLTGDVRLPENLARAGIAEAACLFACTDSDLANIEACLQARRLNPSIRTVARVFDDPLAERVAGSLGIDAAVSSSQVAAAAFVGAAADERALRPFEVGGEPYVAFRVDVADAGLDRALGAARERGVVVLARQLGDGSIVPGDGPDPTARGTAAVIVAGPRSAVDASLPRAAVATEDATTV
jgi:Trk K+ transport system NAD-binding subunit